jgi:hypothetical protein
MADPESYGTQGYLQLKDALDVKDHPSNNIPPATEDHQGTIHTDAYDMMKDRQYVKVPKDGKWPQ